MKQTYTYYIFTDARNTVISAIAIHQNTDVDSAISDELRNIASEIRYEMKEIRHREVSRKIYDSVEIGECYAV